MDVYDEYYFRDSETKEVTIPNAVVEYMAMNDCSIIKAWRSHKKLSQAEVAKKMGISQAAFSQMEQPGANLRKETLQKIADAMGVAFEELHDI